MTFGISEVLMVAVPLGATLLSHALLWGRNSQKLASSTNKYETTSNGRLNKWTECMNLETMTTAVRTELVLVTVRTDSGQRFGV